jgi:phospholipid/cholesterol/gamma-HCH transport system permease protein
VRRLAAPVRRLGAGVLDAWAATVAISRLFGRTLRGCLHARREPGELVAQLHHLGNRSLVFVAVTLGFLGMILVFQVCLQINSVIGDLSQVGAEFLRGLVHEFCPTLTAMMLATRVGAGIAAEVGSMVVTEQVDALRMCGVDPVDYLIVPRFMASVIMTCVLTVFATLVAFFAGLLTARASFGVNPTVFIDLHLVQSGDLIVALLKAVAYGMAIPVVSGYCGLTARGGSEGVGTATTRAVLGSSFAVIILDFILSAVGYAFLQHEVGG